MRTQINPSHKLTPIEGLRGYLALCVLISHVLQATGLANQYSYLKGMGPLAVQCFMIISGFVIFLLLDSRKESYQVFVTRRFFRIFPVYIFLFVLSIPCLYLQQANSIICGDLGWLNHQEITADIQDFNSVWQNIWLHIPLHLLMVHGLIPESLVSASPTAFLGPAWSLSLEWQFYLIAPLWLAVEMSNVAWKRLLMYVGGGL